MRPSKSQVSSIFALLLCLFLWGCSDSKKATAEPEPAVKTDAPQPITAVGEDSAPTVSLDDVPAGLKHSAYEYYGLGNTNPIDLKSTGPQGTQTGARISRLVEIKDGKPIFEVEHTGGLEASLGTIKYSLEPDGIYSVGMSNATVTPERSLELSADTSIGKTWKQDVTIKRTTGEEIETHHTYKVVRIEKVKTEAGEFDALLITANGPGKAGGVSTQYRMKVWLVKGIGPVKMQATISMKGGSQEILIEATKVNK